MKISRTSMGLAIRAARDVAKLTLSDLSAAAGVPISSLSRTENGHRAIEFAEAISIADALGIDVRDLRNLAETFQKDGLTERAVEKQRLISDLNALQRLAIETAIAVGRNTKEPC